MTKRAVPGDYVVALASRAWRSLRSIGRPHRVCAPEVPATSNRSTKRKRNGASAPWFTEKAQLFI